MKRTLYEFCLATGREDLLKQWDNEKNGTLTPEAVTECSHKAVWWQCAQGHSWQTQVRIRARGNADCPVCSRRQVSPGENDLATTDPELAAQWHPTKNGALRPDEVFAGSRKKVWWLCGAGHEWCAPVYSRQNCGCPVCGGKVVVAGYNDLFSRFPELAEEWHPDRNGALTPEQVSPFSNRKVWWTCEKGHEWESPVSLRTYRKDRCPYCSGSRVLAGFNDLKTKAPRLAEEWHPTLNGELTPEMVTPGSHRKVWWQCGMGHVWQAAVYSRATTQQTGCPVCAGRGNRGKQKLYEAIEAEQKGKPVRMEDICACCGAPVPEGRMLCRNCEHMPAK